MSRFTVGLLVAVFAAVGFMVACGGSGTDCSKGGAGCAAGADAGSALDWFTSPCAELGGTPTAGGACYFACATSADCAYGTQCCNVDYQPYCRKGRNCGDSCNVDADCGPSGWKCSYGACYLKCATDSKGAESTECPATYECAAGSTSSAGMLCQLIKGSSGTCGSCPSGCCSPSGLSCCEPPYCSGDCAGSPCC